MSEPIPSPEPSAAPSPAVARIRWQRVATYAGSIALIMAMWICALLYEIRFHPESFVDRLLVQMPFTSSTGKIFWQSRRTLEIDDVKLGDFFYADSIVVTASPFGLLRRHVAKVRITGGQIFTKALYAMMDSIHGNGEGLDWTIGKLEISRGTLMVDHLGLDTAVTLRLGAKRAITLNNLKLGKPDSSAVMTEEQKADLENINIVSPFDPVAPVLAFPLIRIRFTYTELWHHHIREIDLVRPTMFLGEDLFWFSSEFKKARKNLPETGVTAPWEVGHFEVQYGRLAINAFGQPVVHFPFFFDTKVDDIRLDQLDKISAKSTIAIQKLSKDYPDYKIGIVNLSGNLYFSWPPTDATANNVVNTINIDEISWNEIPVTKVSSNVTFDPNGVYGKLSGKCQGGELSGNFEFYYTKGFTWNADFFASKVKCQPIAEKLGGKYLDLTGELDGKIGVQGKSTEIMNCQGELSLPNPGLLEIKSMDHMMKKATGLGQLSIKDQMTNLAIQSFRTYPYENGVFKINYKPEGGAGALILNSAHGSRKFEIYWHPYDSSKVANEASNR